MQICLCHLYFNLSGNLGKILCKHFKHNILKGLFTETQSNVFGTSDKGEITDNYSKLGV